MDFLHDLDKPKDDNDTREPLECDTYLHAMLEAVNDDVTDELWQHFRNVLPDGQLCCPSDQACKVKVDTRVRKALEGRAEQIPGEEKWTYMMKNFKRSLLRKVIKVSGLLCKDSFSQQEDIPRARE